MDQVMENSRGQAAPRKRGAPLRRFAVAVLLLAPVIIAAALVGSRWAEDRVLSTASANLNLGRWEPALSTLELLRGRKALSPEARRRTAELYFRLGEDSKAHQVLGGMAFDEKSTADQRLRELAGRNQRAASLLRRIDKTTDPIQRLKLARKAQQEVPESAGILQRVVQEELMVLSRGLDSEIAEAFDRDYTDLRAHAPSKADELKERVRELLAANPESETR